MLSFLLYAGQSLSSLQNGANLTYVKDALVKYCTFSTPLSANLCIELIAQAYGLDSTADGVELALRLSYALGMLSQCSVALFVNTGLVNYSVEL